MKTLGEALDLLTYYGWDLGSYGIWTKQVKKKAYLKLKQETGWDLRSVHQALKEKHNRSYCPRPDAKQPKVEARKPSKPTLIVRFDQRGLRGELEFESFSDMIELLQKMGWVRSSRAS